MKKTISGTPTQFLYDGLNPVQELNGSNGVIANLLTGLRIDEYFTRTDTATSTFLADALGSTIGLVGSGGTIATSYSYQPFGVVTVGGSANGNAYEFTGRENDGTGLYFYRARYYSPTFQRFIAQDPIDFTAGDANLYGYVFNDSVNETDASGLGDVIRKPPGFWRPRPPAHWKNPPKWRPPTDLTPRLPREAPYCTLPPPWAATRPLDPVIPWVIPILPFCDQFPGLCGPPMA